MSEAATASVLATTAAATAALMLGVWLLSLVRRDASIVDVFWGLGFALIALVTAAHGGGYPSRRVLVAALTVTWGVRLALYLAWRNWGAPEDYRYAAMRRRYGARFPFVSLVTVFTLQGTLMWIISLPVQMAALAGAAAPLSLLDGLGVALWTAGFLCESLGDWQLARFKADPANRGAVMQRGLWAYTRHPNYFGDALLWWGLFLFAAAAGAWWTIVGPLAMTLLLMRVSGVPLLERKLTRTRPAYADYVRRTSAFLPWPRRR